jgi:hypothetical protein
MTFHAGAGGSRPVLPEARPSLAPSRKLSGRFSLTRAGERRWILVKVRDERARAGSDIVAERPASVRSGKTWQDLINEQTPGSER